MITSGQTKGRKGSKSTDHRLLIPGTVQSPARTALRLQVSAQINLQEKITWIEKIIAAAGMLLPE